jgi:hypothetical protein
MRVSESAHRFAAVRGRERGYRRDQVDCAVADLGVSRDRAWERAARLTVLLKELQEREGALREQVAALEPQTYEVLGPRAQELLALAEAEGTQLRDAAEGVAQELREDAEEEARSVRDAARAYATAVRGEADRWAEQCLAAAQRVAGDVRAAARRDAKDWRTEAVAVLKEVRQRTGEMLAEQEREHGARAEVAEGEFGGAQEAARARIEGLGARGDAALAEAQRSYAEAQDAARRLLADAEERCGDVVTRARAWEERSERETEGLLREHEALREELRARMTQVSEGLSALGAGADAGTLPGQSHGADD